MNVSSVKNLNGETFSAVQDATLTNVVQTNSAQWSEGGSSNPEVESYVINNSATIDEVNTTYQSNSANYLTAHQSLADYIPYSTSGLELPNSHFKIDTSGQAYKLGLESGTMPLEFGEVIAGFHDGALTELENGVTYTLTIQGAPDNEMVMFVNLNTQSPYDDRPTITNNQCTFTWTYEDASVGILDYYGYINSTNTTLTYTNSIEKRYVLEDELSSGFLQTSGLEYNANYQITGYNGSAFAGGNIPVSNSGDLYKLEFDGVDLYGVKSNTNIPNYVYSAVSSSDMQYGINASPDPDDYDNEPFYDFLYNWSAFDIISISSNGGQILPASSQGATDVTAVDVYFSANNLYDNNYNYLNAFSGYIGKLTHDNLVISSYIDKPGYYDNIFGGKLNLWFSSNLDFAWPLYDNYYICSVGNKVQSGTDTFEGIFVPTSAQLLPYPMAFVSTSSEATGANILYVVTGSN